MGHGNASEAGIGIGDGEWGMGGGSVGQYLRRQTAVGNLDYHYLAGSSGEFCAAHLAAFPDVVGVSCIFGAAFEVTTATAKRQFV